MKNLVSQIKKARYVFICGNGGSASTAEHFANDLFSRGIKAICLNSNTSIMTMIANDCGYEQIYAKQLEIYANSKDLLITISCSGSSPNIISALNLQEKIGFAVYLFETFEEFGKEDYELLEDEHMIFAHRVAKEIGKKKI